MSAIERKPSSPPATSPNDPRYYDERDLEAELLRTFQICHECRMCVNYCGSFPELFARVDREIDSGRAEGAERIDADDIRTVSEECWQCKLCYIKCPYTKDEDAHELLDFPRLMAREKAVRAKREGVTFTDRVLGEPQLVGFLGGGFMAGPSQLITKNQLLRKVAEKVTGISAEFPLPPLAPDPFPRWMARRQPGKKAGEAGEVVLFATCYGNYNLPEVSRAAVQVLEHVGYRVHTVSETCCGMPNLDGGDVAAAQAKIQHNVAELLPHVREGRAILVPSPTCGYTMKREWPEYVDEPEVAEVSAAVVDLMEFVEGLRRDKALPPAGESLGKVAYHAACHLRAQKIGFPGMRVLARTAPDTEVEMVEQCSAVDGTWGMKAEHYETGRRYAGKLTKGVEAADADLVVTDCPLSALRIQQENGEQAIHPIQALARAYGLKP
ncbi:MAG: heterodisulfide reductase-related iron-sulfur binding cluster [Polyangiaceae bacterium]